MTQVLARESAEEMRRQNPENFIVNVNGRMMREPRRFIYIHTVAKRPFNVTRTLFPRLHLAGCENGERWVTAAVIADPVVQSSPDQERGGQRLDEHDGWRACIDLLNPRNATNDPYEGSGNPDFFANKQGQNLIAEGYWPSLHETPTEKEIQDAEARVQKHYQWLTKEAIRLASRSKKDLDEFLQTYPDTHTAMDVLGLTADWHSPSIVKAVCPNCGGDIRPGVAYHIGELGPCIIDPVRSFKAGIIPKDKMDELMDAEPQKKSRR